MKTTNFKFSIFVFVLISLFAGLNAFAEDVPLLRKDGGTGTAPNVLSPMKTLSMNSFTYMSVTADLTNGELTVDFGTPVGTATVSIVDASGAVVYQVVVDSYNTPEVIIPVDNLSTGSYNLKISYGSTNLIGGFQL